MPIIHLPGLVVERKVSKKSDLAEHE